MNTELELYKFITENKIEYHWNADEKCYAFIDYDLLQEFSSILGSSVFDDDGLECVMKDGYIAFEMVNICERIDVDEKKIFTEVE